MRVHGRIACDALHTKRPDERKEVHGRQWRPRSRQNPNDERGATHGARYLRDRSGPVPGKDREAGWLAESIRMSPVTLRRTTPTVLNGRHQDSGQSAET